MKFKNIKNIDDFGMEGFKMTNVFCIKDFIIGDVVICKQGEQYRVINAMPDTDYNETLEDIEGYIDIQDIIGTVVCWATWMDIDESGCFELVKEI